MKKKMYFFANWKMYLDYDESNILANALANEAKSFPANMEMAVFPSALSLYPVKQVLNDAGIGVGAQNVYWVDKGGYTGEISAQMYKAAGCAYALVGHSERRYQFGETNHDVRQKMEAVLLAGLTPVLCVGETENERKEGKAKEVVEIQLRAALQNIVWPKKTKLIIAYEPVWAIGTGQACSPVDALEMQSLVSKTVSVLLPSNNPIILYGGSVKPDNVSSYLGSSGMNGVLVGGSSTKLDTWLNIVSNV